MPKVLIKGRQAGVSLKAAKVRARQLDFRDDACIHFFASDGGNWTVGTNFTDTVLRLGRENRKGHSWSAFYRVYVVFLPKAADYQISHQTRAPILKRGQMQYIGEFMHKLNPKQVKQYKERYG